MDLNTYLNQPEALTATALAEKIGVTPAFISHWKSGFKRVPIARCVAVEQATDGAVTRKDLRPNDWHLLWPELNQQVEA